MAKKVIEPIKPTPCALCYHNLVVNEYIHVTNLIYCNILKHGVIDTNKYCKCKPNEFKMK